MASVMGTFGRPGSVPYSTAKAAILGFTRSLAHEVARAQHPRQLDRAGLDRHRHDGAARASSRRASPRRRRCGRIGDPDDIAWAAVYLASDEAKFMTGQVISPNGGWYMSQ